MSSEALPRHCGMAASKFERKMCSSVEAKSKAKEESLKLAIAVSLLRSRIQKRLSSSSEADALRWKHKAKERKQEIIRLREDLKEAETSCKCFFFENSGELIRGASELRFSDVLGRRFLRLVRAKNRRKTTHSSRRLRLSETKHEDEAELLRISVDFLVELCEADSHGTSNFSNWSHQAVDFILASLKNVLATGKDIGSIEESTGYLISKLITRICSPLKANEGKQPEISFQFYGQHLICKLGSEPYIGQRAILAVCQRICVMVESLLFMDPFDGSFPELDEHMFTLIHLVQLLICDYLLQWSEEEAFETDVLEEWIASVVNARKAVAALQDRSGLYVLYMDRVARELAKRVGHISSFRELHSSVLENLLALP